MSDEQWYGSCTDAQAMQFDALAEAFESVIVNPKIAEGSHGDPFLSLDFACKESGLDPEVIRVFGRVFADNTIFADADMDSGTRVPLIVGVILGYVAKHREVELYVKHNDAA